MKKKLLALALIMIIAVGGVFAAELGDTVAATLVGSIFPEMEHGFIVNGAFSATIEFDDVFKETSIVLPYGFKVKDNNYMRALMTVGPFVLEGDETTTIPITTVGIEGKDNVSKKGAAYIVLVYDGNDLGTLVDESVNVIITIPDTTEAAPGTYTSTISIEIETDY
ncbi:MAG TPA: hypothetical protein VFC80_04350 [Sphaerochaeta sp.]|nr:hypothetical protein [Sphaerochaeta sp.]